MRWERNHLADKSAMISARQKCRVPGARKTPDKVFSRPPIFVVEVMHEQMSDETGAFCSDTLGCWPSEDPHRIHRCIATQGTILARPRVPSRDGWRPCPIVTFILIPVTVRRRVYGCRQLTDVRDYECGPPEMPRGCRELADGREPWRDPCQHRMQTWCLGCDPDETPRACFAEQSLISVRRREYLPRCRGCQ